MSFEIIANDEIEGKSLYKYGTFLLKCDCKMFVEHVSLDAKGAF